MFDMSVVERLEPGPELARVLLAVEVSELDAEGVRAWVAAPQRLERFVEARRYETAAHYADLHPPEAVEGARVPGGQGTVAPGGDGTPAMGEFAVTDLAVGVGCSSGRAFGLLADGLDLRHRMPELFAQLRAGAVDGFKVRMILRRTRHLGLLVARLVDRRIAGAAGRVGPKRLDEEIERALLKLDPDALADAADAAAARRVEVGPDRDGVRQLFGTVDAFDGLAFDAAVDFVADLLGDLGDTDGKQARRASAVGWLANPPAALALVERHRAWRCGEEPAEWARTLLSDTASPSGPGAHGEPSAAEYAAGRAAAAAGTDEDGLRTPTLPGCRRRRRIRICVRGCGRRMSRRPMTGSAPSCGPARRCTCIWMPRRGSPALAPRSWPGMVPSPPSRRSSGSGTIGSRSSP